MIIGVKFCGNCNPAVDTPGLLYRLKEKMKGIEFVGWDEPRISILLVLNGCETGCATIPEFSGPVVIVAGSTVQQKTVALEELDEVLAGKLRDAAFPYK